MALVEEIRRRLCGGLCCLGRRGEGVVRKLGMPTGEVEVVVGAGHVGQKFGFRHVVVMDSRETMIAAVVVVVWCVMWS